MIVRQMKHVFFRIAPDTWKPGKRMRSAQSFVPAPNAHKPSTLLARSATYLQQIGDIDLVRKVDVRWTCLFWSPTARQTPTTSADESHCLLGMIKSFYPGRGGIHSISRHWATDWIFSFTPRMARGY
jgi:hypothetical protein